LIIELTTTYIFICRREFNMNNKREEAIRLRIEGRKSNQEISKILKCPKTTVHYWLKKLPLTKEELSQMSSERIKRLHKEGKIKSHKKDRGTESKFFGIVKDEKLTRARKAKIAEAAILFRLVLHGFDVYSSIFDGDRIDFIINYKGRIKKIQVKSVQEGSKSVLPHIPLVSTSGGLCHGIYSYRYKEEDFDFIVGYDLLTDKAYIFSFDETKHLKSSITIRDDAEENWLRIKSE